MKKNEKTGLLVPLLFAVYLALLIWITQTSHTVWCAEP